ncbi:MAG: (2Fe-2S)-binding protein [Sarcina sp.]
MAKLIGTLGPASTGYVCGCGKVTADDVIKTIKDGATTLEEIKEKTGASANGCGGCGSRIEKILEEYSK